MKPKAVSCDHNLLRQSLDDVLSEAQEEALARHLSECRTCQDTLEQLAADRAEWSRVEEILKREAHSSGPDVAGTGVIGVAAGVRTVSTADFAVDFLEPTNDSKALGRLGDIDINEVIGHGGMGIVLRGFQRELNRPVAVKVLAPHLATSGAARQRFAREARATAVIVHPNVMPILTVHSTGKLPHLVMPYVACESLQQRLDREGSLATVDVLRIAMQVANGLAAAHAQGLVHRDIKPANVLLEKGVDRAMLTDFGLARAADDASLTRTGVIAGTPQFMSPEQARGDRVDARSDLFSLGSVMYTMCAGRPPFRAETSYGILRRITDTDPRPIRDINPDVPDWLAAVIAKLHAKDADERFQSADELARVLERCLAHVQQPATAPLPDGVRDLRAQFAGKTSGFSTRLRAILPAIRQRRIWLAGGIVACLSIITILATLKSWEPVRPNAVESPIQPLPATATTSVMEHEPVNATALPPAPWGDGIELKLQDMDHDIGTLEQQSSQTWNSDSVDQELLEE